jgi:hypothetical protein
LGTAIYALSPGAVALLARGTILLKVQLSLEQQAKIDDLLVQLQTLDSSIDLMDDTLDRSFSLYKEKKAQTMSLLEKNSTQASTTINKKKDQASTLTTALIAETSYCIGYAHRYLNGAGLQMCYAAHDFLPLLAPPLEGLTAWCGEWWETGVSGGEDMNVKQKPSISSVAKKCRHCQRKPHGKTNTTQQRRHLRSSPIFIRPPVCVQRQLPVRRHPPDPKQMAFPIPIHNQLADELELERVHLDRESGAKNPGEEAGGSLIPTLFSHLLKAVSAHVGGEGSESEGGGEAVLRVGPCLPSGAIGNPSENNDGGRDRSDVGEGGVGEEAEHVVGSDAAGTTESGADFDACVEFEQKACWNCHARFYVALTPAASLAVTGGGDAAGAPEKPRDDSKKMFHFNDEASTCIDGAHFCSGDCLWSWYFSTLVPTD